MITAEQALECAIDLEMAAREANLAYFLATYTDNKSHFINMERKLREAAAALGFDLVPRQTAQEAHEAMIAKRRAEDRPEQADETLGFR